MAQYVLYGLHEIPFNKFQRFLIEGDYTVIGVWGEGITIQIIEDHAEKLYNEFMDLISTDDMKSSCMLQNQLLGYELKLQRIQAWVDALKIEYNPVIIDFLRQDGFDYEFTEDSLINDLRMIVIESRQFVFTRDNLANAVDRQTGGSKAATYQYYNEVLVAISDMQKYQVADTINTMQFCIHFRNLINKITKTQHNGNR